MARTAALARRLGEVYGWRREAGFRRRLGQVGHVLSGNFLASGIALVAVAISAQALGVHDYGVLALIITFARAIERFVSFQSWQPIIRYAAGLEPERDGGDLARLYKFGLALDLAAGLAAFTIALALLHAAGAWFDWPAATVSLAATYCVVLLFNLGGMPIAALRLAGRFRQAAYGQVAAALIRVALCAVAAVAGAGLAEFALIWMATQIVASLALLASGAWELRRQGVRGVLRAPLAGLARRFPELWRFTWSANLSLTLRASANQLDTLLVGAIVGPAGAGLYHVAKQLGKMAQTVGTQVQAVLYPDIARLWAARQVAAFRLAVIQVEVSLGALGLLGLAVVVAAGEPLLRLFAGADFAAAAPLLVVQSAAVVLTITGAAANTALLAMGEARRALGVTTVGVLAFHATLLALTPAVGAIGASFAHLALGLVTVAGVGLALRRALRDATQVEAG